MPYEDARVRWRNRPCWQQRGSSTRFPTFSPQLFSSVHCCYCCHDRSINDKVAPFFWGGLLRYTMGEGGWWVLGSHHTPPSPNWPQGETTAVWAREILMKPTDKGTLDFSSYNPLPVHRSGDLSLAGCRPVMAGVIMAGHACLPGAPVRPGAHHQSCCQRKGSWEKPIDMSDTGMHCEKMAQHNNNKNTNKNKSRKCRERRVVHFVC